MASIEVLSDSTCRSMDDNKAKDDVCYLDLIVTLNFIFFYIVSNIFHIQNAKLYIASCILQSLD